MSNLYVFRIEYVVKESNEYVKRELKAGRLRQGWGGSHTCLLTDEGKRSPQDWIAACCNYDVFDDNEKYYKKKYNNLINMLNIVDGDIIIIPKTPDSSRFTICRASGSYRFEKPEGLSKNDYFHVIPIDVASIREFNYNYNEDCKNIHAKMRAYQSPINNVWNTSLKSIAERLICMDSGTESLESEEIVQQIINSIYRENALQRFRDLGNKETERIVKLIFEKAGYEFIRSNHYKDGGDADLIFKDNSLAEFCDVGINSSEIIGDIYVQVKNKNGIDLDDKHGAEQLVKLAIADGNDYAVKILISTTDRFTRECIDYANMNNILLIDGMGFLQLIFKYIN